MWQFCESCKSITRHVESSAEIGRVCTRCNPDAGWFGVGDR